MHVTVTYWEVVAYGDMIFPQVLMEHIVHVWKSVGHLLITGKLSDDNPLDM
jgi:hypothetical protein